MQQGSRARKRGPAVANGWLLRAPNAWLIQLYSVLPASSKLAVFRSCKQLAKLVVHSASRVKLTLHAPMKETERGAWMFRYSGSIQQQENIERQYIIEALLQGCSNLKLELDTEQVQPYPSELSRVVTVWVEKQKREWVQRVHRAVANLSIMPNLQVLFLGKRTELQDVCSLCDALEEGELPQLYSLGLMYLYGRVWGKAKEESAALQRLAAAAGGRVTQLTTCCLQLLLELPKFVKLQSVAAYDSNISSATAVEHMFQHPTIRTVTFGDSGDCSSCTGFHWVSKDCSKLATTLETLILHNVGYTALAKLPVAGIHEVRFLHQAKAVDFDDSKAALQTVLGCPTITVKCLPDPNAGTGVFHVHGWSEQHTQLIARIEGAHTLHLHNAPKPGTPLTGVWAAVPKCITHITWEVTWRTVCHDLEHLWQGWPEHVTALTLSLGRTCDEAALLQVVEHAPVYVKRLTLLRNEDAYRGAFCNELYLAAPARLKLVIKAWGMPPNSKPY